MKFERMHIDRVDVEDRQVASQHDRTLGIPHTFLQK